MAAPRKSAQQLAAREKARAKAAALTERHEKLIDLAAEFFEQQEQADFIRSDARQKADALLAKAEADAESAVLRCRGKGPGDAGCR
jgi:sulfur relay (sulfurtransferase) DsrC/TusE family protein